MKIGLIRRGHSSTGGAEAYLLRLASALRQFGESPVLITTLDWPEDRWPFGEIIRLEANSPREFASAFQTTTTGCDVHLSLDRVPGAEVFRAGDGVHAAWLQRRAAFEPFWKRATRWMNPKHQQLLRLEQEVFDPANTRMVIANSRLVQGEIQEHFAFPRERISIVYNGLSTPILLPERAAARAKLGLDHHEFCVLFVGTGWERKGLDIAMGAVDRIPTARLLVAGRGPANRYGSHKIKFLGPVSDLGMLFSAADIFALPTWYDPFSNACLEALAAGIPVMTTAANGFSEILQAGIHGEIVPVGDVSALADALEAWRKPGRCLESQTACRERAAEFSMERNASETLQILKSIGSARSRSR